GAWLGAVLVIGMTFLVMGIAVLVIGMGGLAMAAATAAAAIIFLRKGRHGGREGGDAGKKHQIAHGKTPFQTCRLDSCRRNGRREAAVPMQRARFAPDRARPVARGMKAD